MFQWETLPENDAVPFQGIYKINYYNGGDVIMSYVCIGHKVTIIR